MNPRTARWPSTVRALFVAIAALISATAAFAVRNDFEGPTASWQFSHADVTYQVTSHRRTTAERHWGDSSEHIQVRAAAAGTRIIAVHDVGRCRVHADLLPSLWVKSDRAGIQLMAQVVLPRTAEGPRGKPLTVILHGEMYRRVGAWQALHLRDITRLLQRQVRVLRHSHERKIDDREAYIDRLLINIYGGAGVTNVWIDDLDIRGYVRVGELSDAQRTEPARQSPPSATPHAGSPRLLGPAGHQSATVARRGGLLLVGRRPFFARAVEHRGESLAVLKRLGFNTVWLDRPPTQLMLDDARRLGLWLVAPADTASAELTEDAPILCWQLGRGVTQSEVTRTKRLADDLSRRATIVRPTICGSTTDARSLSRVSDFLLFEGRPIPASEDLDRFTDGLTARARMARPGTPFWASVQTEPPEGLLSQVTAMSRGAAAHFGLESEQIRRLTYAAVRSGPRGLLFCSRSRLDAEDDVTTIRAQTLRRLNAELEAIEPWLAAGSVQRLGTADRRQLTTIELRRSKLLLATPTDESGAFVSRGASARQLSLIVSGILETAEGYYAAADGLKPLPGQRVQGGLRINLPTEDSIALALFTQDPAALGDLATRLRDHLPERTAALWEVARRELARDLSIARAVQASAGAHPRHVVSVAVAGRALDAAQRQIEAKDYAGATVTIGQLQQAVAAWKRALWSQAAQGFDSPVASPLCTQFATLPDHWRLARGLGGGRLGKNILPGGDMEDIEWMTRRGWQRHRYADPTVRGDVELSPQRPSEGRYSLRLRSWRPEEHEDSLVVESPPVWVDSPAVRVRGGEIVRISGQVRIPKRITGGDGLLIFDSLGGRHLGMRLTKTDAWQSFSLYRAAAEDGEVRVTFALDGLGQAYLDGVTIAPLSPAGQEAP